MRRIKFPLVMKNGTEVRELSDLQENFDMESVVEYFVSGKLKQWLENYYYEDILEKVQALTGEEEDFGKQLAEALEVEWKENVSINIQSLIKKTKLKESIKPFINDEELDKIEHIADSQDELERIVKLGKTPIYLFGEQFRIPGEMKNTECIGINKPIISIETTGREEFRKRNIKLKGVEFLDDKTKKIALDNPLLGAYYDLLDVMETYLKCIQKNRVVSNDL